MVDDIHWVLRWWLSGDDALHHNIKQVTGRNFERTDEWRGRNECRDGASIEYIESSGPDDAVDTAPCTG